LYSQHEKHSEMTAIVGVLNKHAIAIAADSAATINGALGRKVLNQATKIVTLSKFHPVAVMIYSSSSFLGTPWDVIVKLYRDRLGDNDFDSVSGYISDFIQFLTDNHFFSSDELQKKYLRFQLFKFYQEIESRAITQIGGEVTDSSKSYLFKTIKDRLNALKVFYEQHHQCEGLASYTFERFQEYCTDIFKDLYEYIIDKTGALQKNYLI